MRARTNGKHIWGLAVGLLVLGILFLWVAPVGAVKVVREKSKPIKTQREPSSSEKDTADTANASIRSLLDDLRLQRKSGSATDSVDTWIDRDGDGVNDRLKRSTTRDGIRLRGRQPSREGKKIKIQRTAPQVKRVAPRAKPTESRTEEPKNPVDETPKKKRQR